MPMHLGKEPEGPYINQPSPNDSTSVAAAQVQVPLPETSGPPTVPLSEHDGDILVIVEESPV